MKRKRKRTIVFKQMMMLKSKYHQMKKLKKKQKKKLKMKIERIKKVNKLSNLVRKNFTD